MDRTTALTTSLYPDQPVTLIAVMRALGLPVTRLARLVGVHRSTIYRWARGVRPSRRGWQTALLDIARIEQRRARQAERDRRAAELPLTWRTTRRGERVVYGPAARLQAGQQVVVDGETVTIARVGRPWEVDGVDMAYGYTARPVYAGPGLCRCGCGERLTWFDREASAVPGFKFDCA